MMSQVEKNEDLEGVEYDIYDTSLPQVLMDIALSLDPPAQKVVAFDNHEYWLFDADGTLMEVVRIDREKGEISSKNR